MFQASSTRNMPRSLGTPTSVGAPSQGSARCSSPRSRRWTRSIVLKVQQVGIICCPRSRFPHLLQLSVEIRVLSAPETFAYTTARRRRGTDSRRAYWRVRGEKSLQVLLSSGLRRNARWRGDSTPRPRYPSASNVIIWRGRARGLIDASQTRVPDETKT